MRKDEAMITVQRYHCCCRMCLCNIFMLLILLFIMLMIQSFTFDIDEVQLPVSRFFTVVS